MRSLRTRIEAAEKTAAGAAAEHNKSAFERMSLEEKIEAAHSITPNDIDRLILENETDLFYVAKLKQLKQLILKGDTETQFENSLQDDKR